MSLHSGANGSVPSTIKLVGYDFVFVESLIPECDALGAIRELSPQARYMKSATTPLHKHGHDTFCRFRIAIPSGLMGVYALMKDVAVCYIGECEDLGKRFNMGYGNISPKNCYQGGQPTNCKINHRVLEVSKAGGRIDLYFHQTSQRKAVEKLLIVRCSPPWNG